MKKIFPYLILLLIPTQPLFNNPVIPPHATISELYFDEGNKWKLEISFGKFSTPYRSFQYDSICISTSSGFSRIRMKNIRDGLDYIIITADSLSDPLTINGNFDCIKLWSFLSYPLSPLVDSLCIGGYPGSTIDSLASGYSITRLFFNLFSKDSSPTLGQPNDTLGTCGTLQGFIHDKHDSLVTTGNFILHNPIVFTNNGQYSTSVFSRNETFYHISNQYKPNTRQTIGIDTLQLNVNPGILYNKNIRILDDYYVKVKDKLPEPDRLISVANYPNPFNSGTNFIVHVPYLLQSKEMQIHIYNITGQEINTLDFLNGIQATWDGKDNDGNTAPSGLYYYRLIINGQSRKTGSMILLR
jgi:hypothetical protein